MRKKLILIMTLSCMSFLYSCSDEGMQENLKESKSSQGLTNREGPACTPENSANSWDSWGEIHNQIIDSAYVKKDSLMDVDLDGNITYVLAQLDEDYDVNTLGGASSVSEVNDVLADSLAFYHNIPDANIKYTSNVKAAASDFLDMIESAVDEEGLTYCILKERIVDFEKDVINSTTLTTSEKNEILKFTAVARYSFYYWYQKWGSTTVTGKPWWQWVVVGVVDAAGTMTGTLATGISASYGASQLIDWATKP